MMANDIDLTEVPVQIFEIILEQEDYHPGELISGKLLILTCRDVEVEGIYLKFEGKGNAKWQKQRSYLCGLQKALFVQGTSNYFTHVFRYDSKIIPEGSSEFPFEFEIPPRLPPTIRDGVVMRRTKLTYTVEALIRTDSEDYRQQKQFYIRGLLNLNAFPELSFPVCRTVKEIVFESCLSPSGKVMMIEFSIKKQAFVPGEIITSEVSMKNTSDKDLPCIDIKLIQEVRLKLGSESMIKRQVVAENRTIHALRKKCEDKSDKHFVFTLSVPENALISYEDRKNEFITVHYFIRMSLVQSSFPYKLTVTQIPVQIGTVAIKARKGPPLQLQSNLALLLPKPKQPCAELQSDSSNHDHDLSMPVPLPQVKVVTVEH